MRLKIRSLNDKEVFYYSGKSAVFSEGIDTLIERGLVNLFEDNEKKLIYKNSDSYRSPPEEQVLRWFSLMNVLFITFLLLAIPLSPNSVNVLSTIQPAGILIFPLTFPIIDAVNELFGFKKVRMVIFNAVIACVIGAFLIFFTIKTLNLNDVYFQVYKDLPYLFLINSLCLISAMFFNSFVFNKLKLYLCGSKLWLRCLLSSVLSQILYTIIWIFLFFNKDASYSLLEKIIYNYGFKIIYSIPLISMTYLLVFLYRNKVQKK